MAFSTGCFDRVFFVRWTSSPAVAELEAVGAALAREQQRSKTPLSYLTIVPPDAPVPSAEERKALDAFARRIKPTIEHAYLVIEGDGFKASIQRSVIIGLTFWKERGYTSIFKTVDEALGRIAARTGADLATLSAAARGHGLISAR